MDSAPLLLRNYAKYEDYFLVSRLRIACLTLTLAYMGNALTHIFGEVKPFDWLMLIIEALVLIVIILAEIAGWIRRRKESKRKSFIDARVSELSTTMDSGERLIHTVPDPFLHNPGSCQPWIDSANAWMERAEKTISPYSLRASSEFMSLPDSANLDHMVTAHARTFVLTGPVWEVYERLVLRLANLRRILERPEAYF